MPREASVITPAKRTALLRRIQNRIDCLLPSDRFVKGVYHILIDVIGMEANSSEAVRAMVASYFTPNLLFHGDVIESEGLRFYGLLLEILAAAGVDVAFSVVVPLPLQAAEVLYTSSDDENVPKEIKDEQQKLLEESENLYAMHTFSPFPKRFEPPVQVSKEPPETQKQLFPETPAQKNQEVPLPRAKDESTHAHVTTHADNNESHEYSKLLTGSSAMHQEMMSAAKNLREQRSPPIDHDVMQSTKPLRRAPAVSVPRFDQTSSPRDSYYLKALSRKKSSFLSSVVKKHKEKFSGTDGRSWSSHLQHYIALATAHDITEHDVLLEMVQFTLGPGPKMSYDRFTLQSGATWDGFQEMMLQRHNSAITHARTRDAIMSVSLKSELRAPDEGPCDTRNGRAVTRVVNKILKLAKDLPPDEAQDKHLLQFLRMSIQGVAFTKNAQLLSVQDERGTFDTLSSSVQTAAQVEDSYNPASSMTTSGSVAIHQTTVDDLSDDIEEFEILFVDRRLGRVPPRRSKKCGDNKRENGAWKNQVLKCHDCASTRQLKFHRECPAEIERRKKGKGVLDGVHQQLRDGAKPIQVMACLAIALEDATSSTDEQLPALSSGNGTTAPVETNFTISKSLSCEETRRENELFEANFADRLGHSLERSFLHDNTPAPSRHDSIVEKVPNTSFFSSAENTRRDFDNFFISDLGSCTEQERTPTVLLGSTNGFQVRRRFLGAVVDTGAARSCIGTQQANTYAELTGHSQTIRSSSSSFKFGDICHPSRGIISIRRHTPTGHVIQFDADVIDANVPLLMGLNTLDEHHLLADTRSNMLVHQHWSLPLERDLGHIWLRWPEEILYTREELLKLHRHYKHPSASKLFNLLKRIDPDNLPRSTMAVLKDIQQKCDPCAKIDRKQLRFQVGSGEVSEIVFNREILMDTVKIGERNALHIVDAETHFGAAKFLNSMDTKSVWNALLDCWVLVYAGRPDVFFMDQGSAFTSDEWKSLAKDNGVVLKYSGAQHHNGISICERYHSPLRKIYRKLEIEHPEMDPDLMLKTSIKAMNDTLGPEGLVPTMLVFGIMPRYSPVGLHGTLPSQSERFRAIHIARHEYLRIVNNLRVSGALRSKVPQDADRVYTAGDIVRVYREDEKAYSGPLQILEVSDNLRMVKLDMGGGLHQLYSTSQIKPYKGLDTQASEFVKKTSDAYGPWRRDYVRPEQFSVHITEVLDRKDPRAESPKMKEAIEREIQGLVSRGCFRITIREELPENANVLGSRLVLGIKDENTGDERYKARLVVGGHLDKDKASLVHASPNLTQDSARVLLALASVMGFKIWTQDIAQAYLLSCTKLMREIYIKPTKEFNLSPNHVLQLMKPLYGLADSGDRWHHTLKEHHLRDLSMLPTNGDLSLYYRHIGDRLSGLSGVYVDDTLQAGDDAFRKWTECTSERFDATPRNFAKGTFAGMFFEQAEDCSRVTISMQRYIANKLVLAPVPCSFAYFRSLRAQLAWTTHCRPDVSCALAMSTQVTEKVFEPVHDAEALNKIIRHLKRNELSITFPKLDRKSLHLRAYADASHANNKDLSSQLGIVILLCDKDDRCSLIGYKSYKCQRVTRSALASECHAFADAFDYAYMLKHDLEGLLNQIIPIQMFTDSKSLFDVIVKASRTAERRLMIDVAACREAYEKHEIADIGFIRSGHNLADCMTKIMRPTQLMNVMRTAHIVHPIEQWIVRKTK